MDSVLGFQFEPEIPSNELSDDSCWETCESEDDSDNSHAENLQKSFSRVNISPEEWCKCGNCVSMLSEKECKCCWELENINYFELQGKNATYFQSKYI